MESRILVIGGTGKIGRHLAAASLNAGHPTAVLVRPSSADAGADPVKTKLLEELYNNGARLIYGDINDHESLVAAIEQTDVVISGIGHTSPEEVESQLKIMGAIKDVGNVKRFVPSEYGCNVELAERMLEPARSILGAKLRVRKALRASGIPHTIICSYWIHGFLLPKAGDPEADGPPVTRLAMVHSTLLAGMPSSACEQITVGGDDGHDAAENNGVEATELYPSMVYVSVEEYINGLIM